jgi:hypothetical protein
MERAYQRDSLLPIDGNVLSRSLFTGIFPNLPCALLRGFFFAMRRRANRRAPFDHRAVTDLHPGLRNGVRECLVEDLGVKSHA